MKKTIAAVLAAMMIVSLGACGKVQEKGEEQTQEQAATPDADWSLPETIEMTEEVTAVFDQAMEGLTGVDYKPVGYLGEKDGVYCVLCRAAVVSPDAKPYYALVYVSDDGLENIWDIWMGAHVEKKAE
jgi:predicted small lipoprotein YifL